MTQKEGLSKSPPFQYFRRFAPITAPWRHTRQSGFRLPQGHGGQFVGQQKPSLTLDGQFGGQQTASHGAQFSGQSAPQLTPPGQNYQQSPVSGDVGGQPEQPSYADNEVQDVPEEDEGDIDLHNKEFCVDVSSYEPVIWKESQAEVCGPQWRMMCTPRSEQICQEVAETKCDVSRSNQFNSVLNLI